MKQILLTLAFLAWAIPGSTQRIPVYDADKLMSRVHNKDTTYILNFWATWCGPCIRELPSFDTLQRMYEGKPVKVLLVSFDFKESYPDKLTVYIRRKQMLPEVVWFSQTDATEFIPKIDKHWSGALPATMVINWAKSFQVLLEKPVGSKEVQQIVAEIGQ